MENKSILHEMKVLDHLIIRNLFLEKSEYLKEAPTLTQVQIMGYLMKNENKENSSQTATVYARNTGLFEDSYHVYYYSDEIEELATPLFQDKPFIRNYQLEVQGHTTTTEWNGKESVKEYLKKREYEIETSIYLNEGKTDEEYAEEISYIMQEIVESDLVFNISVYTNDDNIIFYSLPEQHSQPDVEAILEKMEDVRSLQETKEDYKEWKKQNQNNEKD